MEHGINTRTNGMYELAFTFARISVSFQSAKPTAAYNKAHSKDITHLNKKSSKMINANWM